MPNRAISRVLNDQLTVARGRRLELLRGVGLFYLLACEEEAVRQILDDLLPLPRERLLELDLLERLAHLADSLLHHLALRFLQDLPLCEQELAAVASFLHERDEVRSSLFYWVLHTLHQQRAFGRLAGGTVD